MEDESSIIEGLSDANPGYEELISQLYTTLSSASPPFIYITDSVAPRITANTTRSILQALRDAGSDSHRTRFAQANAVACVTPRLLYDTILNGLAGWNVDWANGCENWTVAGNEQRWNDSMDGFLHGLQAVANTSSGSTETTRKGKRKVGVRDNQRTRMVVTIERAEKLKETLPDLIVPLTRLGELSRVEITTIFISCARWEDIRPSLGASPDPYFLDIPPPTKQAIVSRLRHSFLAVCSSTPRKPSISPDTSPTPYHQSLLPLYTHFASVLYSICAPSTLDPFELAYVASACWPAFVQPVLDEHRQRAEEAAAGGVASPELEMPGEDMRMRLIRHFTPSVTAALEALYPRMMDAQAWVTSADIEGRESAPHGRPGSTNARETLHAGMEGLPRMAKFILVAAFLASTNPAKSDLRMFGRGLDEKKRRRKGGGFAKLQARKGSGDAKPVKIPQRLSGPMPFPLDRLVAILGVLLEENDVDSRLPAPEFAYPGEYTEMEIGRTQVYALIVDLANARLLTRTSLPERLDGPPMFKCGISYVVALALARGLDVPLQDLLWDPA